MTPSLHTDTPAAVIDPTKDDVEQYRISDQYPPNKESLWPYPKELDGWVLGHNALRGEMTEIRLALESIQQRQGSNKKNEEADNVEEDWFVPYLQDVWSIHETIVHHHHNNEENFVLPELRKRFKFDGKVEADHNELVKQLDKLSTKFQNLSSKNDNLTQKVKIDALVIEWRAYENMIRPHFLEEENTLLVLLRAYFTHKEWNDLIMNQMKKTKEDNNDPEPKYMVGSFIHYQGGEEKFRNGFMKREGIPWFVWYIAGFGSGYKLYKKVFLDKIHVLQTGELTTKTKSDYEDRPWWSIGGIFNHCLDMRT